MQLFSREQSDESERRRPLDRTWTGAGAGADVGAESSSNVEDGFSDPPWAQPRRGDGEAVSHSSSKYGVVLEDGPGDGARRSTSEDSIPSVDTTSTTRGYDGARRVAMGSVSQDDVSGGSLLAASDHQLQTITGLKLTPPRRARPPFV